MNNEDLIRPSPSRGDAKDEANVACASSLPTALCLRIPDDVNFVVLLDA